MNSNPMHHMYYLALVCPPAIDAEILTYKHWMRDRFGCTVALKSPAHITLIPPFWLDGKREEQLRETLHAFRDATPTLNIDLQQFGHFGNRVIFVQVKENHSLGGLKRAAEDHFSSQFPDIIRPDDRPFHPHVTIANRDIPPSAFREAWQYFSGKTFSASFETDKITLLKLRPGRWDIIEESHWS